MCYIIHDGPALNRMPLSVDEVIVDLRETGTEAESSESLFMRGFKLRLCCGGDALTLWKTSDMDFVKASAAISQWILNTL